MSNLSTVKEFMQKGDFVRALDIIAVSMDSAELNVDERIDALYMQAVCQRKLDQTQAALDTIHLLLTESTNHARGYQERGFNYQALQKIEQADSAFREAVTINPGLTMSWRSLAMMYKAQGRLNEATYALVKFTHLANLPPALQTVTTLFHEKKFYKAEQICRHYMQQNSKDVEGMRLLAMLGIESKVMDDAEFLLESAVEFEPDHFGARIDYAVLLLRRQKFEKALKQIDILLPLKPQDMQLNILYADALVGVGKPDEALNIYASVIARYPDNHYPKLTLGHAHKTLGNVGEAIKSYQSCYQHKKDFGDAYWSLANLKTYCFSDQELNDMIAQEANNNISTVDRVHFCFGIGKCFEDRKEYKSAFEYYERGNALKNQGTGYSIEVLDKRFDAHIETCTKELFDAKQGMGWQALDPIFIVGLPRAGSTLLEQIIASHSQVDGTMELPNILGLAYRLQGRSKLNDAQRYPAILKDLTAQQLNTFGEQFIQETKVFRNDAPFFIDKMPNNFIHIGLIKTILPNAKIIDARRHPMGCCFSGFKQLFGEGQDFSYGQIEIGRYYKSYVELMDHWDTVLPGQVLRVQYEDVVADLETQVHRILDYLGLPFEQNCVNYHQNDRDVRTPSAEQVRQPIFKSGVDQWRHFEPFLGPLKDALGDEILQRYPI